MSIHSLQPNETLFLENSSVLVTNARFIVGTQTYAMNGVTSVKEAFIKPNRTIWIILAIVCAIAVLTTQGMGGKAIAGIFMVIFGFIAYSLKGTSIVMLQTSSGEVKAVESKDASFIRSIIAALNNAIIHRG